MEVKQVTKQLETDYEQYVTAHPSGSFLQTIAWGEFQREFNKDVKRYLLYEADQIVGAGQFLLKQTPKIDLQYLYCAYGPLLEPNVSPVELINQLKKDFPSIVFIKLEPKDLFAVSKVKQGDRIQPPNTLITDLTKSEEVLLQNMHQKTRYNIKVADKHGVKVEQINTNNQVNLDRCLDLLEQTSQRQGFKDHPMDYYKKLIASMPDHRLYLASYNDKPLASAVMIDFGKTRTYLFGGSSDEHKNVMAPYALHWQAMKDAKTNGLINYDWWGLETASGKTAGFAEFKQKFGGNTIEYPPAVDIVVKSTWYTLYKLLHKLNRLF